jgi:hypothetical protein
MSDRKLTVELLSDWLWKRNCTPVTAAKDSGHSLSKEHGPWSGVGFVQDLALASAARHAVLGDPARSSFALVNELIEYDRRIEAWRKGRQNPADLLHCRLPGPDTAPTFRHHSFLEPLAPVQVMDQYIRQHSIVAFPRIDNTQSQSWIVLHRPRSACISFSTVCLIYVC